MKRATWLLPLMFLLPIPRRSVSPEVLTFDLPQRGQYTGVVEDRDEPLSGVRVASGHLQGAAGSFTLVQSGDEKWVTLRTGGKVFEVAYDRRGRVSSVQEHASRPARCGDSAVPRPPIVSSSPPSTTAPCSTVCQEAADAVLPDAAASELLCETETRRLPVVIEAMIGYSNQARNAVGDVRMRTLIAAALHDTNVAFRRSQVAARIVRAKTSRGECVGTFSYDENATDHRLETYLRQLFLEDGTVDDVLTQRNRCKADVVLMIAESSTDDISGLACRMTRISRRHWPYAYAVVKRDGLPSHLFTHELSHIMGAGHHADGACRKGACSYANAWPINAELETVVGDNDLLAATLYVSNPDVRYNVIGPVTGSDTADNARTLRVSAPTVASFR
jgi:hypothetical protein